MDLVVVQEDQGTRFTWNDAGRKLNGRAPDLPKWQRYDHGHRVDPAAEDRYPGGWKELHPGRNNDPLHDIAYDKRQANGQKREESAELGHVPLGDG